MRVAKKRFFTLIEILVVFALLASLGTVVAVSFQRMVEEQRFYSDVRHLKNQLQFSADLMWLFDADVTFELTLDESLHTLEGRIQVEKPLKPFWKKLIEQRVVLSSIASLVFEGKAVSSQKILFSLGRISQGRLEVMARKGGKKAWIDLPGYPTALVPVYS